MHLAGSIEREIRFKRFFHFYKNFANFRQILLILIQMIKFNNPSNAFPRALNFLQGASLKF